MLRHEAAGWLARLQSGRDPDVQRRFRKWHDAHPSHAAAFERVEHSYRQAGLLRQSGRAAAQAPAEREGRRPESALQLLAAAALVVLVGAGFLLQSGGPLLPGNNALMLVTAVGEIRTVSLADGSNVTLDTGTRVRLVIGRSRRHAELTAGRARFRVARASQPFVIETPGLKLSTREGVIDVGTADQEAQVQVLAGAGEVDGTGTGRDAPVVLEAGRMMTADRSGAVRTSAALPSDWPGGMLRFDAIPLADAVAVANRYSNQRIILAGDVGSLRVTGGFRAGDTRGLARAIAAAFRLSLDERADGALVLARGGDRNRQKKRGG